MHQQHSSANSRKWKNELRFKPKIEATAIHDSPVISAQIFANKNISKKNYRRYKQIEVPFKIDILTV